MADESSLVVENPEPTKGGKGDSHGTSVGKPIAKSKGVESGPHYLRASSGSCHDVCKYGTAHEFEKKPKLPVRKTRRPIADIQVEIFVPDDKKGAKLAKPSKPDADPSHPHSHSGSVSAKQEKPAPRDIRSSGPSNSIRRGAASQTKALSPSAPKSAKDPPLSIKFSSPESSDSIKLVASSSVRSRSPAIKATATSSLRSSSVKASKLIKQEVPVPAHRKTISSDGSDYVKPSNIKSVKSSSRESFGSTSDTLKSKSRPVVRKQLPAAYPAGRPSSKVGVLASSESKIGYSQSVPRASTKKTLALSPTAKKDPLVVVKRAVSSSAVTSTSSSLMSKLASTNNRKKMTQNVESQKGEDTSKNQNSSENTGPKELGDEKAPEKTLHVIKVETDCETPVSAEDGANIIQSQLVLSPGSLNSISQTNTSSFSSNDILEQNSDSEFTDDRGADDSFSDYDEEEDGEGINVADGLNHGNPRNSKMLVSLGNGSAPVKLKFRRGKVVELQSNTDDLPRRLRFRRRRSLNNDPGVSAHSRRRLKGKPDIEKVTGSDPVSEKVTLRHQDTQAKKNNQGLLNNVIEETASKLVETRKSKVKALVGAFETVITSLQEGKSSGERSSQSSPGR